MRKLCFAMSIMMAIVMFVPSTTVFASVSAYDDARKNPPIMVTSCAFEQLNEDPLLFEMLEELLYDIGASFDDIVVANGRSDMPVLEICVANIGADGSVILGHSLFVFTDDIECGQRSVPPLAIKTKFIRRIGPSMFFELHSILNVSGCPIISTRFLATVTDTSALTPTSYFSQHFHFTNMVQVYASWHLGTFAIPFGRTAKSMFSDIFLMSMCGFQLGAPAAIFIINA